MIDREYKDRLFSFNFDLTFDGVQYTLSSYEDGEEIIKTHDYLLRYEGKAESSLATYDAYVRYVLTNDENVTWAQLVQGMFSLRSGDYIAHDMVYSDLISSAENG